MGKDTSTIRFINCKAPKLKQAVSDLETEGMVLDLHRKLRLVGLTFGIEPTSATMGWAAVEPMRVVRGGQALPVSGLALHFTDLTRFEVAFGSQPPGQLDYFELLNDPDPTLRFFFEGGTVRVGAAECRAEVIAGDEGEEGEEGLPGSSSGLLQ